MEIEIPQLHERIKEKPICAFSPFPLAAQVEAERSIFGDRSRRRIFAGIQEPLPSSILLAFPEELPPPKKCQPFFFHENVS